MTIPTTARFAAPERLLVFSRRLARAYAVRQTIYQGSRSRADSLLLLRADHSVHNASGVRAGSCRCKCSLTIPVNLKPLRLWGGIECSVVRVGEVWRDQGRETGHHERGLLDITAIADLGLHTLRYPLLWERSLTTDDDEWHDRQVHSLERHGIDLIGGLVHHGSGPAGTDLLDPGWTPLNEPLTTARFSCLYGHWSPHLQNESAFMRAIANQCRAILLSMRAIRAAQPAAWFVHTEDIGRVFATRPVAEQARYENARRWLSLDLLCGKVSAAHPFRAVLEAHGVEPRHLDELLSGEAAPDIIGFNHYVTSDRYLDHRLGLYPVALHGGNGSQSYVDTEAVRADLGTSRTGIAARIGETWRRYRLPIAITEAHLGCEDQREQVRWLMEAWEAAQALRSEGADIRAVTVWALLGLMDWDSLLRKRRGHYEPGAFDASQKPPRPTLLADAVASLARNGYFSHGALEEPGWWRRSDRVHAKLRRHKAALVVPNGSLPEVRGPSAM